MLLVTEAVHVYNIYLLYFTAFCSYKKIRTTIYKRKCIRAFCICSFFATFVFGLFVSTGKVIDYIYYVLVIGFFKLLFAIDRR